MALNGRAFAEVCGLRLSCERPECLRRQECRGPIVRCLPFPHHPLPTCAALMFDEHYRPVLEWERLREEIREIGDDIRRAFAREPIASAWAEIQAAARSGAGPQPDRRAVPHVRPARRRGRD